MLQYDVFEFYDPLTGKSPPCDTGYFDWVAMRARAILKGRTTSEIEGAYNLLVELWDEYGHYACEIAEHDGTPVEELPEFYRSGMSEYSTGRDFLELIVDRYDVSEDPEFPGATWAQYLAIIALAMIAQVSELFTYAERHGNNPKHIEFAMDHCSGGLAEAVDAVAIAEQLQRASNSNTSPIPKDKSYFQEAGRRGGIAKSKAFRPIHKRVCELYDSQYAGKDLSNANAAKRIWEQLTEEEQAVFRSENPSQQIQKWIGVHLKQSAPKHSLI